MCWGTETMGDDTELDSQRRDPKMVMFEGTPKGDTGPRTSHEQTWGKSIPGRAIRRGEGFGQKFA